MIVDAQAIDKSTRKHQWDKYEVIFYPLQGEKQRHQPGNLTAGAGLACVIIHRGNL